MSNILLCDPIVIIDCLCCKQVCWGQTDVHNSCGERHYGHDKAFVPNGPRSWIFLVGILPLHLELQVTMNDLVVRRRVQIGQPGIIHCGGGEPGEYGK